MLEQELIPSCRGCFIRDVGGWIGSLHTTGRNREDGNQGMKLEAGLPLT